MPPRPHAWRAAATRNHNRGTWRTAREKCRGSGGLTSSSPACPIFCPSSIRRRKRPRLHTCTRNSVRAGQHGGNHGISRHPVHQDFSPRTSAIMICWRAFAHDTQGRTAVNPAAESTKHAPFPLKKTKNAALGASIATSLQPRVWQPVAAAIVMGVLQTMRPQQRGKKPPTAASKRKGSLHRPLAVLHAIVERPFVHVAVGVPAHA